MTPERAMVRRAAAVGVDIDAVIAAGPLFDPVLVRLLDALEERDSEAEADGLEPQVGWMPLC